MFLIIENLLTKAEVKRMMELSETIKFVPGSLSNPHSTVKDNLQPDINDPGYKEAGTIVRNAIYRSREFRDYAFPKNMVLPMMTKYKPGMFYGIHADAAIVSTTPPLRTDVSTTVFISDPDTYVGGELAITLISKEILFKEKPGNAVVYPSTTQHEVKPVKSGERIVAITFTESHIQNPFHRELLYNMNEAVAEDGLNISQRSRERLDYVSVNLTRMWSDT